MIKSVSNLLLTILGAGLIAMLTIVWDSKVSQADYNLLKSVVQKDIALIKKDMSYTREDVKEIKEMLIKRR
jgi:hypothetical protein